jgi:hypothetical protein
MVDSESNSWSSSPIFFIFFQLFFDWILACLKYLILFHSSYQGVLLLISLLIYDWHIGLHLLFIYLRYFHKHNSIPRTDSSLLKCALVILRFFNLLKCVLSWCKHNHILEHLLKLLVFFNSFYFFWSINTLLFFHFLLIRSFFFCFNFFFFGPDYLAL